MLPVPGSRYATTCIRAKLAPAGLRARRGCNVRCPAGCIGGRDGRGSVSARGGLVDHPFPGVQVFAVRGEHFHGSRREANKTTGTERGLTATTSTHSRQSSCRRPTRSSTMPTREGGPARARAAQDVGGVALRGGARRHEGLTLAIKAGNGV